MMVKVSLTEKSQCEEFLLNDDFTLSRDVFREKFPSLIGLRYRHLNKNIVRAVQIREGYFHFPLDYQKEKYTFYGVHSEKPRDESEPKKCTTLAEYYDLKPYEMIVMGVPEEMTNQEFQSYFSKFGKLDSCELRKDYKSGKNKGYGFLKFSDFNDQYNCITSDLKIGNIDMFLRLPTHQLDEAECRKRILVTDITPSVTLIDLLEYFNVYGKVTEVFMPPSINAYAFLTFSKEESVNYITKYGESHRIFGGFVIVERVKKNDTKSKRSQVPGVQMNTVPGTHQTNIIPGGQTNAGSGTVSTIAGPGTVSTNAVPGVQTNTVPGTHITNTVPGVQTNAMPQVQSNKVHVVQTNTLPEVQTNIVPEVQTNMVPEVQTDTMPGIQSNTVPGILPTNTVPGTLLMEKTSIVVSQVQPPSSTQEITGTNKEESKVTSETLSSESSVEMREGFSKSQVPEPVIEYAPANVLELNVKNLWASPPPSLIQQILPNLGWAPAEILKKITQHPYEWGRHGDLSNGAQFGIHPVSGFERGYPQGGPWNQRTDNQQQFSPSNPWDQGQGHFVPPTNQEIQESRHFHSSQVYGEPPNPGMAQFSPNSFQTHNLTQFGLHPNQEYLGTSNPNITHFAPPPNYQETQNHPDHFGNFPTQNHCQSQNPNQFAPHSTNQDMYNHPNSFGNFMTQNQDMQVNPNNFEGFQSQGHQGPHNPNMYQFDPHHHNIGAQNRPNSFGNIPTQNFCEPQNQEMHGPPHNFGNFQNQNHLERHNPNMAQFPQNSFNSSGNFQNHNTCETPYLNPPHNEGVDPQNSGSSPSTNVSNEEMLPFKRVSDVTMRLLMNSNSRAEKKILAKLLLDLMSDSDTKEDSLQEVSQNQSTPTQSNQVDTSTRYSQHSSSTSQVSNVDIDSHP